MPQAATYPKTLSATDSRRFGQRSFHNSAQLLLSFDLTTVNSLGEVGESTRKLVVHTVLRFSALRLYQVFLWLRLFIGAYDL